MYHFLPCWLCVFGLILRQRNSSSNAWFGLLSFPFCAKNNPEQARENFKILRVVRREGEFFIIPTVFALEGSMEKNCLPWNDTPFAPKWDQIKRE